MPRRIPIRAKLAAALAVPICALLLVSALEVAQSISHTNETEEQTELATASIGPGGLIASLQNERNYGSLYILGFEGALQLPVSSSEEAAEATDAAIESFRAEVDSKGGDVAATYAPALDAITSEIDALRQLIIDLEGPRNQERTEVSDPFFNGFTELIDTLFQANGQVALAIDDPTLRRGVELTDLTSHQIENIARTQRVILLAGVGDGLRDPNEIAEAAGLVGQIESNLDQTRDLGVGRYGPATGIALEEFDQSGYLDLAESAIETGQVQLTEMLGALSREENEGFNGYRIAVNDQITARATELNDAASASQWRYVGLAALALVVAGLVTWLVSRSITKPLRSLTHQAKEMAEHRLPEAVTDILDTPLGEDVTVPTVEPVRVNTRDEVADVADALNTVQDSALDLAVEQAVLRRNIADSFVNLGRRNQNLLGRQLDFITELETNETDADTLANLFRLDHLATRMRRNAESLLVLAGIEPPRQWAAPVRLTDVIRAALGEVENYQRVTVRGVEPATILGSAAADLAHLIAELVENALVFSPPDVPVDIRGRIRDEGGYILAIIDSGLGMSHSDIAAANRRLAGAESFTIAPSKYLGHYVAGNLAARHDIRVRLDTSPDNGITATITLPPALLTTDTALAAPVTPPGGNRMIGAPGGPRAGTTGPHAVPASAIPAPPMLDGAPTLDGAPGASPNRSPVTAPTSSAGPAPGPAPIPGAPATPGPTHPWGPAEPAPAAPPTAPFVPDPFASPSPSTAPAAPPPSRGEPRRSGPLWPGSLPLGPGRRGAGISVTGGPVADVDRSAGLAPTESGLARRSPVAPQGPVPEPLGPDLLARLARYAADPTSPTTPTPATQHGPPTQHRTDGDRARQQPQWRQDEPPDTNGDRARQQPRWRQQPADARPASARSAPAPTPGASSSDRSAAPAAPVPSGASPLTPPDALTKRVKGAQLPRTNVISLHDRNRPTGPAGLSAPAGSTGHAPLTPGPSKATDVQTLLASFTAGVQRGLTEARSGGPRGEA